jgi:DNA (cytosine-5)-methyltransferase 1
MRGFGDYEIDEITGALKARDYKDATDLILRNQKILTIDGTRVGDVRVSDDQTMQTVIQRWGTGGGNVPAIFPIQGTVIGRSDTAGPQGKGHGKNGDPMFTLDRVSGHGVATPSTVRRLTPTECERLQGFPDGWTEGQADSHRYKQMGNAVAVPVVQWLIDRV